MHHLLTSNGSSEFYITSVERGQYLGEAGCFNPHLIVVLDPGVQSPKFTVTAVGGDNTYTIRVNGLFIRGQDDRVYSFEDGLAEDLVIIPREADGAYTIQRMADNTAWTAPPVQTYLTPCNKFSLGPLTLRHFLTSYSDLTPHESEVVQADSLLVNERNTKCCKWAVGCTQLTQT